MRPRRLAELTRAEALQAAIGTERRNAEVYRIVADAFAGHDDEIADAFRAMAEESADAEQRALCLRLLQQPRAE